MLIDDARWDELEEASAGLDRTYSTLSYTRPWTSRFTLIGLVGEEVFARTVGESFDPWRKVRATSGDGGRDFAGIDVKGTEHDPANLMVAKADRLKASFYASVFVSLAERSGRYVGFATKAMLESAPVRDFGRGPARWLSESELLADLPPPYGPAVSPQYRQTYTQAVRDALASMARFRAEQPAHAQWIADGYPYLTEDDHVARFGCPYLSRRRR